MNLAGLSLLPPLNDTSCNTWLSPVRSVIWILDKVITPCLVSAMTRIICRQDTGTDTLINRLTHRNSDRQAGKHPGGRTARIVSGLHQLVTASQRNSVSASKTSFSGSVQNVTVMEAVIPSPVTPQSAPSVFCSNFSCGLS